MILTNLDQICRRTLLEKGLPIHYYVEMLVHSSACIRELSFDSLQIINTVELPVDDYGAVDLPGDFVDDLGLSMPGGMLNPIPHNDSITPLRYHDEEGNFTTPPTPNYEKWGSLAYGFYPGWFFYWNINDYGEPTGRYFGARGASDRFGYKVIKDRRQIQLTGFSSNFGSVVLMYISDGQSVDAATQIDTESFSSIQAWINWKRSPNSDNPFSPEAKMFDNNKRLLRARKDDLTKVDLIHIVRRSYTATMKS